MADSGELRHLVAGRATSASAALTGGATVDLFAGVRRGPGPLEAEPFGASARWRVGDDAARQLSETLAKASLAEPVGGGASNGIVGTGSGLVGPGNGIVGTGSGFAGIGNGAIGATNGCVGGGMGGGMGSGVGGAVSGVGGGGWDAPGAVSSAGSALDTLALLGSLGLSDGAGGWPERPAGAGAATAFDAQSDCVLNAAAQLMRSSEQQISRHSSDSGHSSGTRYVLWQIAPTRDSHFLLCSVLVTVSLLYCYC